MRSRSFSPGVVQLVSPVRLCEGGRPRGKAMNISNPSVSVLRREVHRDRQLKCWCDSAFVDPNIRLISRARAGLPQSDILRFRRGTGYIYASLDGYSPQARFGFLSGEQNPQLVVNEHSGLLHYFWALPHDDGAVSPALRTPGPASEQTAAVVNRSRFRFYLLLRDSSQRRDSRRAARFSTLHRFVLLGGHASASMAWLELTLSDEVQPVCDVRKGGLV